MRIGTMKWVKILICIGDGYSMSEAVHQTKITYSHITKVVNDLEDMKMLNKELVGRKNKITLTAKGRRVYELCKNLMEELK